MKRFIFIKVKFSQFYRIILFYIFFIASSILKAQNPTVLPNVVAPSPEASSLTKYLEYPVSNATGIPDINIPLYTIRCGQLSVPISLSYHSEGRRVDDKTGAVGIGWLLNAGGMISRVIYGDPDDNDWYIKYPVPWRKTAELSNHNDFRFLAGIDNRSFENIPQYDTEYDIFTYFVNGLGGNFILKDVNNVKIPTLIPKKPYLIHWHQNQITSPLFYNYCENFELIDDDGIIYRFGKTLVEGNEYLESSSQSPGFTGWMLTEMISANKEDTIHFKYQSFTSVRKTISTKYSKIANWYSIDFYHPAPTPAVTSTEPTSEEIIGSNRLSEISFRNGRIVFNIETLSGNSPDHNLLIKSFEIKDKNNITIKKIEFTQSILNYFYDGIMPTYKLDNVIIRDKSLVPVENYSFEYYPTIYPVSYPNINVRFADFWGYYNASGKTDMCPFIPTEQDNVVIVNPNADRNTYLEAMKSGVLRKITYPTGGSTEFIYQANKYLDQGTLKACGGLRIYQIKSIDLNNNTLLKTYEYGISRCGYGYLPLIPSTSTISYKIHNSHIVPYPQIDNSYDEESYFSYVVPLFNYVAQKPVIYTEVTEYQGDENNNAGKTVYTYDREDITAPTLQAYGSGIINYKLWKRSDLLQKMIYAKTNSTSNPYSLTKTEINNYVETTYPDEAIYGLRIRRLIFMLPEYFQTNVTEEYYAENYNYAIYSFGDYTIEVGKKELTQTTETEYTSNGGISTSTSYVFDTHHLLKEQNVTDSKGNILKKEFLHPIDFTGNPYNDMVTKNMVGFVVSVNEYNNSTPLISTKTNYDYFQGTSIIAPSYIQTTKGTGDPETRIRYYSYDDRANILSVSKENDLKYSYIWGYSQTYPVAKIVNASLEEVKAALGGTIPNLGRGGLSAAQINSLRSGLPKALITTYTYMPLIGMTSSTDPNGVKVYYEYDDFGRLKLIKDDDGHILKTYEYHYKQ